MCFQTLGWLHVFQSSSGKKVGMGALRSNSDRAWCNLQNIGLSRLSYSGLARNLGTARASPCTESKVLKTIPFPEEEARLAKSVTSLGPTLVSERVWMKGEEIILWARQIWTSKELCDSWQVLYSFRASVSWSVKQRIVSVSQVATSIGIITQKRSNVISFPFTFSWSEERLEVKEKGLQTGPPEVPGLCVDVVPVAWVLLLALKV